MVVRPRVGSVRRTVIARGPPSGTSRGEITSTVGALGGVALAPWVGERVAAPAGVALAGTAPAGAALAGAAPAGAAVLMLPLRVESSPMAISTGAGSRLLIASRVATRTPPSDSPSAPHGFGPASATTRDKFCRT